MKILSHDLNMSSKHVEYSRVEESKLTFEGFVSRASADSAPPSLKKPPDVSAPYSFRNHNFTNRSISAIIQQLLNSLTMREQKETPKSEMNAGFSRTSFYQKREEFESMDFSTKGLIKTDKGELNLNVNFSMSRSFMVENGVDIFTAFDPLVVNLDGETPQLSGDSFSFDLDNDGESDQISKLKGNSGFLALDKDHDGVINQGTELFGTLTGNGFGELRGYDLDGNGWIDENDAVFDKLQIWLKNDQSKERELIGLGESGIGAIFLESAQSEFTYKTQTNEILGKMKSSGIFLNEDGSVGNMAQIDLSSQKGHESLAQLLRA